MTSQKPFLVRLLVISDRAHRGERADQCESTLRAYLAGEGYELDSCRITADEIDQIRAVLKEWSAERQPILALTAGGTGLSPRDVTPEATRPLLDREIPGIPEAMRAASMRITPYAALSRGHAGFIGSMLTVNLPGSPKAAVENLGSVFSALEHAMKKAMGDMSDCKPIPPPSGPSATPR